jgi:large subunit ribosomal protein L4
MPKVEVRNLENKVVESIELADAVFDTSVNEGLMHDAVRQYLASRRSGAHSTKTRAEVAGSGRKPWRQKGSGRARVGEVRNPLWRGGGTVFGPRPRKYAYQMPKKMFRAALCSALTVKLRDQKLSVIDAFGLETHRTKPFAETLGKLGLKRKVLLVDHQENSNLLLASRNLSDVSLIASLHLTPYQLLNSDHVVFTKAAILGLEQALAKGGGTQ